jgi:hypothetical protein
MLESYAALPADRVEALEEEISFLRQKLESHAYDSLNSKQDKIEALNQEIAHLKASLDGKLINVTPGDILLVDSQKLLQNSPAIFMQLAKKYGCTFVSVPEGGVNAIGKLSSDELEGLNLKKIDAQEKTSHSHKVKTLAIEIETALQIAGDDISPDFRSHLFNASKALKAAHASLLWLEQNVPSPVETQIPTGAMLGG